MHWHKAISALASQGEAYVIATVLATSGSAPRPAGTKMVITERAEHDTLGGGQLEHLVIERSRVLLQANAPGQSIEHFPLAAAALQCCGGSVTVLLESFTAPKLRVAVFGAGHIGQRVVNLLQELNARVVWIDDANRAPEGDTITTVATETLIRASNPTAELQRLPEGTHLLILTHDHQLDYALLQAALSNHSTEFASIGMIGSTTKSLRFRKRLQADNYPAAQIDRLRCPLGKGQSTDKQPMAIAIAIVAELLNLSGTRASDSTSADTQGEPTHIQPLSWQHIKSSLVRSP